MVNFDDEIDIAEDTAAHSRKHKGPTFDWSLNLGHVAIVISFLLGTAGLYGQNESRYAVLSARVDELTDAKLAPRVSTLEAQTADLRDWMKNETDLLRQIRDLLDTKQDKPHH